MNAALAETVQAKKRHDAYSQQPTQVDGMLVPVRTNPTDYKPLITLTEYIKNDNNNANESQRNR